MTVTIDAEALIASQRAELKARIAASKFASDAAYARGDEEAGLQFWREHIGLLEVEMGRSSSAERLTMTPAVPAER